MKDSKKYRVCARLCLKVQLVLFLRLDIDSLYRGTAMGGYAVQRGRALKLEKSIF